MVDVLGLSHYAPMPLQMTFASFEVRTFVGVVFGYRKQCLRGLSNGANIDWQP
jgi:hypothetical protein